MIFPRRYCFVEGRRVLIGLSPEETAEFKSLDGVSTEYPGTVLSWRFEGAPTSPHDKRWLALYQKHDDAFRRLGQFRRGH